MLSGGGRVGAAWYELELRDEGFLGQVQNVGQSGAGALQPTTDAAGEVEGALTKAGGAAENAGGRFGKFGGIAQGAVMGVGLAIGSMATQFALQAPIAAVEKLGESITLASDKAESASKVNVLFGDSADIIQEASKHAADTVALSSGAYLAAAGDLGNLITNLGITGDQAANMSVDMLQLAADMGSFNNASTEEVTYAMGAAFRGETEPIRRFGVMLDANAVSAKAVELGLAASTKEVSDSARAQATYALILEQTSGAQGDLARTADGLANSTRLAAARQEEALTRLGEHLLPLAQKIVPMLADGLTAVIDVIVDIVEAIENWIDQNQPLIKQAQDLAHWVGDVLVFAFQLWEKYAGGVLKILGALIGLIVDTIGAVVDLGGVLVNVFAGKWDEAAAHGQLAMERLGGIQANVQRIMGDQNRSFLDQQAAAEQQSYDEREAALSQHADELAGGYVAMGEQIGSTTEQIADDTTETLAEIPSAFKENVDLTVEQVDSMLQGMADATGMSLEQMRALWKQSGVDISSLAGKTAEDAAAAVKAGADAAVAAAAWGGEQTPGAWADGVRSEFDQVTSSMEDLKDLMKNTLSPTQKEAELIGIATSKRLAKALDDNRPEVRGAGQQIALDTIAQLHKLDATSPEIGKLTTKLLASASAAERPALQRAIDAIVNDVTDPLSGLPAAGTQAGAGITQNLAGALRRGSGPVYDAAWDVARKVSNILRVTSPAKEGPWSVAGGPFAWADKVGTGYTDILAQSLYAGGDEVARASEYVADKFAEAAIPRGAGALGDLSMPNPTATIRHLVEFDGKNLPDGVTNEGVAGVLGNVLDFDRLWADKMAAAQAASGLRWVR